MQGYAIGDQYLTREIKEQGISPYQPPKLCYDNDLYPARPDLPYHALKPWAVKGRSDEAIVNKHGGVFQMVLFSVGESAFPLDVDVFRRTGVVYSAINCCDLI